MPTEIINVKKAVRDLHAIGKKITRMEEIATVRTLNIIAGKAKTMIANDVNKDTGISKGTARRRIVIIKASKGNFRAALDISRERVTYPSPRQLKRGGKRKLAGGVSFIGSGKARRKITKEIKTDRGMGTVPFVIKGRKSRKKIAVYVLPKYRNKKGIENRKVRALYFSSLAHLARKDWQQKVNELSIKEIKKEYPKQLKKAKFTGRF